MRLWSYGDSHAAGHELGSSPDLGREWLKKTVGFDSRLEAKEKLGGKYTEIVREKWYDHLENVMPLSDPRHCNPSLSYAGVLSQELECDFINRAKPGSSNDYMAYRMLQDMKEWMPEDIILISVVTPYRFMPKHNLEKMNYQLHWLPFNIQNTFDKYGASNESILLWNQGLVTMMKAMHIGSVVCFTTDDDMSVLGENMSNYVRDIPLSLSSFVAHNYEDDMRYLGGHFHEDCHMAYAEYIKGYI